MSLKPFYFARRMSLSFLGEVDLQALLQRVERRAEVEAILALMLADQTVCASARGLVSCVQHCRLLETLYVRCCRQRSAYCLTLAPMLHAIHGLAIRRLSCLSEHLREQLQELAVAEEQAQAVAHGGGGGAELCLQLCGHARRALTLAARRATLGDYQALQDVLHGVGSGASKGNEEDEGYGQGPVQEEKEKENGSGTACKRRRTALTAVCGTEVAASDPPCQRRRAPSHPDSELEQENNTVASTQRDLSLSLSPGYVERQGEEEKRGAGSKEEAVEQLEEHSSLSCSQPSLSSQRSVGGKEDRYSTLCQAASSTPGYSAFSNCGSSPSPEVDLSLTL